MVEAGGGTVVVGYSIAHTGRAVDGGGRQWTAVDDAVPPKAQLNTRALRRFASDSEQIWRKTSAVCGGRLVEDVHNVAPHVIR